MDDEGKPARNREDSESSENEEVSRDEVIDEIQSTTTTLAIKAPTIATNFSLLLTNLLTNLNNPPENWLKSNPFENLDGFNSRHYLDDKFSSIRMAFDYMIDHAEPPVDVITASKNIKKMLKLALTDNNGLSMFVHPVNGTLLIDNFDVHKWLSTPNPQLQWEWLRTFFLSTILENRPDVNNAMVRKNHTNEAITERNLMSKLLHYSLFCHDSDAVFENNPLVYHMAESSESNAKDVESSNAISGLPKLPDAEEVLATKSGKAATCDIGSDGHARTLMWKIEDIRMLIGSDMPIFGDTEHPSVSLRLANMNNPINILTGLDYWLDNLMCQVPEVLMCFHLDGIIQKYQMIRTEDLPKLSNDSKFDEAAVMRVAKNILAFLRRNATKEGHTYWLFKAKDSEYVKLYDLTSLCDEKGIGDEEEAERKDQGKMTDEDRKNPFQNAVAMLLYKLARNLIHKHRLSLLQSKMKSEKEKEAERIMDKENKDPPDAAARRVLLNCMALLNKEKFPQIAASASYLLSDIYIPDDLNPLDPDFGNHRKNTGPSNLQPGGASGTSKAGSKKRQKEKRKRQELERQAEQHRLREQERLRELDRQRDLERLRELQLEQQRDLDRKKKDLKRDKPNDDEESVSVDELRNSVPSRPEYKYSEVSDPLPQNVSERCFRALENVDIGLYWAKFLQAKKSEFDTKQRKAQEQRERDNPKMSKPMEPIPMPYKVESESSKKKVVEVYESAAKKDEWHADLKAVLFRKAFLVYVTSAELKFSEGLYGHCVRTIKKSLNCFFALDHLSTHGHGRNIRMLLSFAYGVAGDAFMALSEHWDSAYVRFLEGFNGKENKHDKRIAEIVEEYVDESKRDWVLKVPKDVEECLFLALKCFKAALDLIEGFDHLTGAAKATPIETIDSLNARYGNALNISASLYIRKATNMAAADFHLNDIDDLLGSAESMFLEAFDLFQKLDNKTNCAVILSNLGMLYRTWAFAVQSSNGGASAEMSEEEWQLLEKAIHTYKKPVDIANKATLNALIPSTAANLANVLYYSVMELWQRSFLKVDDKLGFGDGKLDGKSAFFRPCEKTCYLVDLMRAHYSACLLDSSKEEFYSLRMGEACLTIGEYFLKYMLEYHTLVDYQCFSAFCLGASSALIAAMDIFLKWEKFSQATRALAMSIFILVYVGRAERYLLKAKPRDEWDIFIYILDMEVLCNALVIAQQRVQHLGRDPMEPFEKEEIEESEVLNRFLDQFAMGATRSVEVYVGIKKIPFSATACLRGLVHLFVIQLKEIYSILLQLNQDQIDDVARSQKWQPFDKGLSANKILETLKLFKAIDNADDLGSKDKMWLDYSFANALINALGTLPLSGPVSFIKLPNGTPIGFLPGFNPEDYYNNFGLRNLHLDDLTRDRHHHQIRTRRNSQE